MDLQHAGVKKLVSSIQASGRSNTHERTPKVHLESTGRAGIGAVLVGTAARSGVGYT